MTTESCSVCGTAFEMQFRFQMEARDGGHTFFCSQRCQAASVSDGVECDVCNTRFRVDLVAQVVRVSGERRYACSEVCRARLLAAEVRAPTPAFDEPCAIPPVLRPRRATLRRIAVFNHKGGTGKTTTCVTVAAGLAARGLRVLVVDTDSQGNVAHSLGIKPERSLYHVLVMGLAPRAAAVNVRPNLDVIAANETLAAAELYLAGRQTRDRILRDRLEQTTDYDVVLLDCSPSLSLLNQNALVFADGVLVPVACDFLSLVGVRQVLKTVKNVNALLHHPVQIWGVLPTFYDSRARICRDALETLQTRFGDRCLDPIRQATRVKEAPASSKTLFEHAPDSHAALDYERVVDRIITGHVAQSATSVPMAATA
jgi:chromosome partitioning protein